MRDSNTTAKKIVLWKVSIDGKPVALEIDQDILDTTREFITTVQQAHKRPASGTFLIGH